MDCRQYAQHLLEQEECDLDCYKGVSLEEIVKDLTDYFEEHPEETIPFPIDDIAACLRQIGDEQPDLPPAPYKMVYDMGDTIDSIPFDSFEAAKTDMEDAYTLWIAEEMGSWTDATPTRHEIDSFNDMVNTCCCWVVKYDEEVGGYEDIDNGYTLPQEELEAMGWKEIESEQFNQ